MISKYYNIRKSLHKVKSGMLRSLFDFSSLNQKQWNKLINLQIENFCDLQAFQSW